MQRKNNRFFTHIAATATVAIAAALIAVGAPAASAATRTINVGGVITAFTPKTINVTAGETVSICLASKDIDHDLTISSLGFKVASKAGGPAVCKTLTAPKAAGSSAFICSLPGHASAGMRGTLVVKAASATAPKAPAAPKAPSAPQAGNAPQAPDAQAPDAQAPQAEAPAGGVAAGGGSTAGVTHVSLLTLGGGLLIAAMMSALFGWRVARRN
jgi:uncharacterized cupredoxin-like copper-binding protein